MERSLHLNRDKAFHRQRRRVWDNAFKTSLSTYAPDVEHFTDQLLAKLRSENGQLIPLSEYTSHYSYDAMAALAFGKSMGFIKGEQSDVAASILSTFTNSVQALGYMYHMPWLMNTIGVLTSFAGPMKEWRDWSVSQMRARMKVRTIHVTNPPQIQPLTLLQVRDARPDLISHLIVSTPKTPEGCELLFGESRLIISAGSETTSTALAFIFMHLATRPHYMTAIRTEFLANAHSYDCQHPLPLLEAVIYESLRIWPSVFFGSQRVTPPEGMEINGHFVPGNTIVHIPLFPLFHDPRNFVAPDEFIPERWTTRPELVRNRAAFIPFSTGPYSCAGKALAMMELRSVVGRVIAEFDVRLDEGVDVSAYWEGIKDHFTAGAPKVMVRFVKVT